jgi:hypothetical protein
MGGGEPNYSSGELAYYSWKRAVMSASRGGFDVSPRIRFVGN